jgi:hypothetical protein
LIATFITTVGIMLLTLLLLFATVAFVPPPNTIIAAQRLPSLGSPSQASLPPTTPPLSAEGEPETEDEAEVEDVDSIPSPEDAFAPGPAPAPEALNCSTLESIIGGMTGVDTFIAREWHLARCPPGEKRDKKHLIS